MELARRFHRGATDKAGRPYLSHVQRVVDAVTTSDEQLAAALHDLLEDTSLTSNHLFAAGCPSRIIIAVEALTHRPEEDYEAYLRRVATDPIARPVKCADIADNADENRLALLDPEEAARLRSKYERARAALAQEHEPGPEMLQRLREAEWSTLGTPSGEPDAWTTFWCSDCGRPAGTVMLIDHQVALITFMGSTAFPVQAADLERVRAQLKHSDVEALYKRDPELAPFWCRICKLTFCGSHWAQETLMDHGFFDEIRGTCPRGHRRTLWD
jgi:hypothetical protein